MAKLQFGQKVTASTVTGLLLLYLGAGPAAPNAHTLEFDGVDLYKGLVQWRGPVADIIPEIAGFRELFWETSELEETYRAQVDAAMDEMIGAIEATDSSFWVSFESEIRSGNHLRIQRAIHHAALVTVEAAREHIPEVRDAWASFEEDQEFRDELAMDLSALMESEVTSADVDRMIDLFSTRENSALIPNSIVLFAGPVVVVAAFSWFFAAQSVAVAVLAYWQVALPPKPTPDANSLAFSKRLNEGRLIEDRLIDRVAHTFALN